MSQGKYFLSRRNWKELHKSLQVRKLSKFCVWKNVSITWDFESGFLVLYFGIAGDEAEISMSERALCKWRY